LKQWAFLRRDPPESRHARSSRQPQRRFHHRRFNAFLAMKREVSADIETATRAIVDEVAARGDAALLEATQKFDRLELDAGA